MNLLLKLDFLDLYFYCLTGTWRNTDLIFFFLNTRLFFQSGCLLTHRSSISHKCNIVPPQHCPWPFLSCGWGHNHQGKHHSCSHFRMKPLRSFPIVILIQNQGELSLLDLSQSSMNSLFSHLFIQVFLYHINVSSGSSDSFSISTNPYLLPCSLSLIWTSTAWHQVVIVVSGSKISTLAE